jgi:hypothetical protein
MPFTVTLTVCGVSKRPGWYVTVSVPTHDTSAETAWAAGEGNTTPLIASAAAVSKIQRRICGLPISQNQIRGNMDLYGQVIVRSRGGLGNGSDVSDTLRHGR